MTPHPDLTFTTRGDGQIDAHLGDPWTVFDHALGDAISSLPPRGSDENDAESMPLDDFLGLLAEWRERVLAAGSHATIEFPETYRRNPIPLGPGEDAG